MDIMWNRMILRRQSCSVRTSTECLMLFNALHIWGHPRSESFSNIFRTLLLLCISFVMKTCHESKITLQPLGELLLQNLHSDSRFLRSCAVLCRGITDVLSSIVGAHLSSDNCINRLLIAPEMGWLLHMYYLRREYPLQPHLRGVLRFILRVCIIIVV